VILTNGPRYTIVVENAKKPRTEVPDKW